MAALRGTAASAKAMLAKQNDGPSDSSRSSPGRSSSFARRRKLNIPSVFSSSGGKPDSDGAKAKERSKRGKKAGAPAGADGAKSPTGGKPKPEAGGGKNKKLSIPSAFQKLVEPSKEEGDKLNGHTQTGALDFKPIKIGDYQRGALQGGNNMMAVSEVSHAHAHPAHARAPCARTRTPSQAPTHDLRASCVRARR